MTRMLNYMRLSHTALQFFYGIMHAFHSKWLWRLLFKTVLQYFSLLNWQQVAVICAPERPGYCCIFTEMPLIIIQPAAIFTAELLSFTAWRCNLYCCDEQYCSFLTAMQLPFTTICSSFFKRHCSFFYSTAVAIHYNLLQYFVTA